MYIRTFLFSCSDTSAEGCMIVKPQKPNKLAGVKVGLSLKL